MRQHDVPAEDHGTDLDRIDDATKVALQSAMTGVDRPQALPWVGCHGSARAIGHIENLENFLWHTRSPLSPCVYLSDWSPLIVVAVVPLSAVLERSVRDWYSTYTCHTVSAAIDRLTAFPEWPHDGRTVADLFIGNRTDESRTVEAIRKASMAQLTVK